MGWLKIRINIYTYRNMHHQIHWLSHTLRNNSNKIYNQFVTICGKYVSSQVKFHLATNFDRASSKLGIDTNGPRCWFAWNMIIMPVHTFYMKLIQLFLYLIGLPVDLPQVCWGQVTSLQLLDVKKVIPDLL